MFYRLVRLCLKLMLPILTRWRVTGVENVPLRGRLIVASNHLHFLDPFVLAAALPRQIIFMGKVEVFETPVLGWLARLCGGFPVRRGEVDRRALRRAVAVLEAEEVLGMLPEGTRSRSGQLQHGRGGVILVALRTGAPILPIGLTGTEQVLPALRRLHRPELVVTIGEPLTLPSPEGRVTRQWMAEMTDRLMRRIAILLPPAHRGSIVMWRR